MTNRRTLKLASHVALSTIFVIALVPAIAVASFAGMGLGGPNVGLAAYLSIGLIGILGPVSLAAGLRYSWPWPDSVGEQSMLRACLMAILAVVTYTIAWATMASGPQL